jgi:flagella basal body P-ring formation protein FlgA
MKVTLLTFKNFLTYSLRLLISLGLLCALIPAHAAEVELLDSIRLHAQEHVLAQLENSNLKNATATAGSLDPRLQLKKCSTPLETFSTGSSNNSPRTTVGVKCNGLNPWTLYVPVTISAVVEVVFSKRALTRGSLLVEEDFEVRQLPLNKLPMNYLSDSSQLVNFELTRSINAGVAVTLNTVRAREIIRQGQEVIIVAQASGLQVRMAGKALKKGNFGDLIPVQNLNSGRTIEATVMSDSTVSVNL